MWRVSRLGLLNGLQGLLGVTSHPRVRCLFLSALLGIIIPIAFPLGHMLLFHFLWSEKNYPVDRNTCTCNCWDTAFKGSKDSLVMVVTTICLNLNYFDYVHITGPYESGVAHFKHVYFNSTPNTLKMWIITVVYVICLYETIKYFMLLAFNRTLRGSMALLLLSSLHSHYYNWWMHWGYWNDDFYPQWAHQFFFTFTELASTVFVIRNLDKGKGVEPHSLIFVGTVASFHILSSGLDQFVFNVLNMQGKIHQVKLHL
jgi:hypothetical protein